jgi:hypothetical protein
MQALVAGGYRVDVVGVARMMRQLRRDDGAALGRDASALLSVLEAAVAERSVADEAYRKATLLIEVARRFVDEAARLLSEAATFSLDTGSSECSDPG